MKLRQSSKVALIIGAGAGAIAFAAIALIRPPAPSDQMALPDRASATIVRDFAKKVMAEIAALAAPEPRSRTIPDYDIDLVRAGESDVPHIFAATLPVELIGIIHTPQRKNRFLAHVLPLVLKVNEEIAADRARLTRIAETVRTNARVSAEDQTWLAWVAERYDAPAGNLDELLVRVDIIPTSLALAQAAEESGWGTSRFAHQGNALFGQRATGDEPGLAPVERATEEHVRVRAYETLGAAVRSYARNLNTHPAYERFRAERAENRSQGAEPGGHALAPTLTRYSERGAAYVASLRAIIRLNRLESFDKARLVAAESVAKL